VKILSVQPNLVEQVHEAILLEISSGKLAPGSRIIQEQIASELGVSRQPVQQALLLLRNQGVLSDAPGRGLIVAPLDPDHIRHMYDVRAVIEGLAFRKAALNNADLAKSDGPAFITKGREAAQTGSVSEFILATTLAGKPLAAAAPTCSIFSTTHRGLSSFTWRAVRIRREACGAESTMNQGSTAMQ
jgi:DNA-binding GntR family transcriptional regulator